MRYRVAVTGAAGSLGHLLLPLLEKDPAVDRVVALDLRHPGSTSPKVVHRKVDLVREDQAPTLEQILQSEEVDVLYHLAFSLRRERGAVAHELEVMGTLQTLRAVASAKVKRLIVPSLTALYGARPDHPAFVREEAPLHGCPQSRFIQDKVQVEEQVRAFRASHPGIEVFVLRFAPIVGPDADNPFMRFLSAPCVPTLMGFDPLVQVVHQQDAGNALHLALSASHPGNYNIVGKGVIPLSGVVRQAGKFPLPLPRPFAQAAFRALGASGSPWPESLLSYLHYSWVADGTRAASELGFQPRYHVRDAVKSLARS